MAVATEIEQLLAKREHVAVGLAEADDQVHADVSGPEHVTGGVLDLQTASGTIQVKSAVAVETMNRNRLSGRLGGSGAVAVRTSSGDITLATNEGGSFE